VEQAFDHIIVGAGSAGCVLARRLGEDPRARILVLEAGDWDRSPLIKLPLAWGLILKHRRFDWGYFTEPESQLDGRRIECARGKVIGGCSAINGMAYSRGAPQDYEHWAHDLGLPNWGYADVLPYFKRAEQWSGGADAYRGGSGPLVVQPSQFADPLVDAFMSAVEQAGHPLNPDSSGLRLEGFGPMQTTIRRGRRWSAANAYLRPAMAAGNVTVWTGTIVTRVVLEDTGNGHQAIGVEVLRRGQRHVLRAEREVLLCGGVVNSPQLLMLSGIGEAQALQALGITPQVDLPGVGRNLQDHLVADVSYRRRKPGPLHQMLRMDRAAIDVLRSWCFGRGVAATIPAAVMGYIRSQPDLSLPDAQLILAAGPMTAAPYFAPFRRPYADAFGIKGILLQPESRGRVFLASADPLAPPRIEQNFLSTEGDRRAMREIVRRMREIGAQPALQSFAGDELTPGVQHTSDEAIDAFIRRTAITLHHPVGTCRMGPAADPMAVLDEQFRVRGVGRLRVIDGAAMPRILRGNTHAPIVMMAEKAADLILGRIGNPVCANHEPGPSD
jgi:4-pyridoxate dehydrogenase